MKRWCHRTEICQGCHQQTL